MWIYFLEVKNIAFPLDLFSQIDLFKICRLDYFSRTNQLRTLRICFLQTVYVVVNFRLSMTSELLLIFVMFFVSGRTESFQIIQQIKRRIGGTRQTCYSSAVLVVQGKHVHQSASIGNLLVKSSISIFPTH